MDLNAQMFSYLNLCGTIILAVNFKFNSTLKNQFITHIAYVEVKYVGLGIYGWSNSDLIIGGTIGPSNLVDISSK